MLFTKLCNMKQKMTDLMFDKNMTDTWIFLALWMTGVLCVINFDYQGAINGSETTQYAQTTAGDRMETNVKADPSNSDDDGEFSWLLFLLSCYWGTCILRSSLAGRINSLEILAFLAGMAAFLAVYYL